MDATKYLLADYQHWLAARMAPGTTKKYMADALSFVKQCGHPLYVDKRRAALWYTKECTDTKPNTSNRKLAAIRALYRYLQEYELREDDPTAALPERRKDRALPNPIEHATMIELLETLWKTRDKSKQQQQDLAILEVLYGSGLRRDECARLRLSNIVNENVLRVMGKGRKERLTVITGPELKAVMEWMAMQTGNIPGGKLLAEWFWKLKAATPEMPLFYSEQGKPFLDYADPGHQVWLRVRQYAEDLRLPLRPHRFRHSFGTELVENEVPLQDVADVMGHESINTTRGYVARGERGLRLIKQRHAREV
jgi:integrase/recombinase XerC